jgi:hypothetical protein
MHDVAKMTSPARAAAARLNGKKSRGPITLQGKSNSARNSRRHGLRSQNPFHPTEKTTPESQAHQNHQPHELAQLTQSLIHQFDPQSLQDWALIEIMAKSRHQSLHLERLETHLLNEEIRRLESESKTSNEDQQRREPQILAARAYRNLADKTCILHLINRHESRASRNFHNALTRLLEIRDLRSNRPDPAMPARLAPNPETANYETDSNFTCNPTCDAQQKMNERTRQPIDNKQNNPAKSNSKPNQTRLNPTPTQPKNQLIHAHAKPTPPTRNQRNAAPERQLNVNSSRNPPNLRLASTQHLQ